MKHKGEERWESQSPELLRVVVRGVVVSSRDRGRSGDRGAGATFVLTRRDGASFVLDLDLQWNSMYMYGVQYMYSTTHNNQYTFTPCHLRTRLRSMY